MKKGGSAACRTSPKLRHGRTSDLPQCAAIRSGRLWYLEVDEAVGYAMHSSRSHDAVIRVYDAAGNVIETHEHKALGIDRIQLRR
jgi:hypothetical protein